MDLKRCYVEEDLFPKLIASYEERPYGILFYNTENHRMKELGAARMTGGGDPFYEKIGYGKGIHWYCYKRNPDK